MSQNFSQESDQEQPIRARVPDHVAGGAFSTGVIVMTANTEIILDFVQNLGRPYQIVARVVLPHYVLPQLVDALQRNMDLYRIRWGELPSPGVPNATPQTWNDTQVVLPGSPIATPANPLAAPDAIAGAFHSEPTPDQHDTPSGQAGPLTGTPGSSGVPGPDAPVQQEASSPGSNSRTPNEPSQAAAHTPNDPAARQATAQEIYDELKIRDELLSGSYANAVMIGHGAHEFSFDFITNFYPHSSVSSRVFLAAGQIPRLFDSLRGTWEQLRVRLPQNGMPPNPPQPPSNPPSDFDGGPIA